MASASLEEICGVFGKRPGDLPDERMFYDVLGLLLYYGRFLPREDRPGPLRVWQQLVLPSLIKDEYWLYEAARQAAGKSTISSIYLSADMILGNAWCVGMPTLEQASSIVLNRALSYMRVLEKPLRMRRTMDNVRHVKWEHGAQIRALSTNEAGIASSQGYTCRGVLIDEAHEMPFKSLGYFTPLIKVAMRERRGKLLVIGPAGDLESMIENFKTRQDCACHIYNDEAISVLDDARRATLPSGHPELKWRSWREAFAQEEATTDPITYNQFYRLLPVTAGGLLIFPALRAQSVHWGAGGGMLRFTLDVGKLKDAMVCGKWVTTGNSADLVETRRWHGISYPAMQKELSDYIFGHSTATAHNVAIEVNGPGEPFVDFCIDLDSRFRQVRRIKTTDNVNGPGQVGRKTKWLKRLIGMNLRGELGVHEARTRSTLAALAYCVGTNGRYEWPHSDDLSVCWLLTPLLEHAVGI
jgi:hypothetical protein